MKYIIALDQGTTSSRAIVFDENTNIVSVAQKEYTQIYPQPGYVEHDPMEIYASQYGVFTEAVTKSGIDINNVEAIGITNQRETTILWDRHTGKPIYNAIVWQCRRTASICEELKERGLEEYIRETTGLMVDAYFSATKIMWILDNVQGARNKAENGDILFGTVDTWLIWNLSGGRVHVTDYTNASRTMLYNINTLTWDDRLIDEFNIPRSILPEVISSGGVCAATNILGKDIPIAGIAGDQQAALFGQYCFSAGDVKNTYGTGCFLLMNTGDRLVRSKHGLITTIAAGLGAVQYALEGSVFTAGAVVQWLRDELRLITNAAESEKLALEVSDNSGVYIVPAFSGLGAPYWDMHARGTMVGITRGTNRCHIVRAALESIAYQTKDILDAMQADTDIEIKELSVDGGASANNFLMQFQADVLGKVVLRPSKTEATALGAALLAGVSVGVWKSIDEIKHRGDEGKKFTPHISSEERKRLFMGYKEAVQRTLG